MVKREKANYLIQSVSHALDVLEELAKGPQIGVTELSKRLKLHKNNVFRLLATLELRGYSEQNKDTEDYSLGPKVLQLGQAYLAFSSLVNRSSSVLRQLADSLGETVSLVVLQNGHVQYPLSFESKRPVRVHGRVNVSFPAKMNAAGRLLTAQLPDAVLSELLATNTPQDAAIRNQLHDLRSTGMIVDRGAIEADVVSISKTVRGLHNEVVGAIEVLIPQYRGKTEDVIQALEDAAKQLSAALGGDLKKGLNSGMEKEVVQSIQR